MIKYVCFYAPMEEKNRNCVLAAKNKIDYILDVLAKNKLETEVISLAWSYDKHWEKSKTTKTETGHKLLLPPSLPWTSKGSKGLSCCVAKLWLLLQLIKCKRDDIIILYHSLSYMRILQFAKSIKKFKLVLELEEIYSDVKTTIPPRKRQQEIEFFTCANAFIFPTILINEAINTKKKPYIIIHGTYKVEPDRNCKINDNKIHCIYAGTLDPRKGGAVAAAAAEFLDERYHIHIIGAGTESEKKYLLTTITEISKQTKCTVTYDGLRRGEDYIRFIQSCDIGLSTQNPNAQYNDTSFPSKILSYMANGLRVVSIKIKAMETSAVNDLLYYYEEDTPQAIAEAIKKININDKYNSRARIALLNEKLCENISELFN